MNHSNRERQAELEQQLRLSAQRRESRNSSLTVKMKIKWAAIGATAISLLGALAFLLIAHAR